MNGEEDDSELSRNEVGLAGSRWLTGLESSVSEATRRDFHTWLTMSPELECEYIKARSLALAARGLPHDIRVKQRRIEILPGTDLSAFLKLFMRGRTFRTYVQPAISEWQQEYVEAVASGNMPHARWVKFRGYFLVIPPWLYGLIGRAVAGLISTPSPWR